MELTFSLLLLLTVMSGCRGWLVNGLGGEPRPQGVFTDPQPLPLSQNVEGTRIIGGVELDRNSWPYLVQVIGKNGTYTTGCGGSIIDESHVLTAAHCFGLENGTYFAVAGEHSSSIVEGVEQLRNASEVHIHPDWNMTVIQNDVAVMKLSTPFDLNVNVSAIQMNTMSSCPKAKAVCTVSGWGLTNGFNYSSASDVPKTVDVIVGSERLCNRWPVFGDGQLCVKSTSSGACQGDSGGPLVCQCGSEKVLSGIVSFGFPGCTNFYFPTVYARVSSYLPWIKSVMASTTTA